MSRFACQGKPPKGFEYIEPTLNSLEEELRARLAEPIQGKKKNEILWVVHQINWQKTRYVYDLYFKYHKIEKNVYQYCLNNKLVDAGLIAKWRKPGYDRLCSTYVVNKRNYKYGTTSICRVPRSKLKPGTVVHDHTTGCRGCSSGAEGYENIFGNRYGQRLAKIQIIREELEERGTNGIESELPKSNELLNQQGLWVSDTVAKQLQVDQDSDSEPEESQSTEVDGVETKTKRDLEKGEEDEIRCVKRQKELRSETEV